MCILCVFLCLTYSVWVSRSVHISANGTVLFLLWLSNIPLYICITSSLFIPLSLSFFLPSSFLPFSFSFSSSSCSFFYWRTYLCGNNNPICKTEKETQMYGKVLDSMGEGKHGMIWENSIKTCIWSSVKQITSPGWMHETSTQGWCTGKTQRDGMGVQDGEHM